MNRNLLGSVVSCFLMISGTPHAEAVRVDFNNLYLIDEQEAQSLSNKLATCPLSVHGIPKRIAGRNIDPKNVEELILFGNKFSMVGAQFILDYALEALPYLRILDLSACQIGNNSEHRNLFCNSLNALLQREKFEKIILTNNDIAEESWIENFFKQYKDAPRDKLEWHIEQF